MKLSLIKKTIKITCILFCSICIGVLLLWCAFMLPTEKVDMHIKDSVDIFEKEQTYPILTRWCTSKLDNFTDSLMILTAAYDGEESNLEKVMLGKYNIVPGEDPTQSLIKQYKYDAITHQVEYARYWHGYLLYLKPLLLCMDYEKIRILNLLIQTIINLYLIILLNIKKMKEYIIPYILTIGLLMPLATAWSLQFSVVFYIFSIGSIILVLKNEKWLGTEKYNFYFLFLGIATSFFDFLTYPLVTFGIPVIFYFSMNKCDNVKKSITQLICFLFHWGTGYVGMWAGKWIVASIVLRRNVLLDSFGAIQNRSSLHDASGMTFSILDVLNLNIEAFLKNPIIILAIIFLVMQLILAYKYGLKENYYSSIIIFVSIAILPFIWYIGASNHSFIHFWFTYKELIITAFSIFCLVVNLKSSEQ